MGRKVKPFISKKDAYHFHLVHRSQHDPLIADEASSKYVLHQVGTPAEKIHTEVADQDRMNRIGEAAQYGIYFDDTEYDYMQHLRSVGEYPDSVLLEAPKKKVGFQLPEEVLPSKNQIGLDLLREAQQQTGLNLDLDPSVREVLVALDDEEYVDDNLDEDFFQALNADTFDGEEDEEEDETEYFKTMKQYRKSQQASDEEESESDQFSEPEKTFYSMTSSVLPRSEALVNLDDHFEQVLKLYEEDDGEPESKDVEAYEPLFDEFLTKFELKGKHVLDKTQTNIDQLEELRKSLLETNRESKSNSKWIRYLKAKLNNQTLENIEEEEDEGDDNIEEHVFLQEKPQREMWDCETIISTYSNLENRPAIIRDPSKKVVLDSKGFPKTREKLNVIKEEEQAEEKVNLGLARPAKETPEEKRARKQKLKDERKQIRTEKKMIQVAFKREKIRQQTVACEKVTKM